MKNYSITERDIALAKLPKPVSDFLGSKTLSAIYAGIEKKLGLTERQGMMVVWIGNVTLLGLEDEHAVETNLHQMMPELSNAKTRELVADMNDRIFNEARRRARENVFANDKWMPDPPTLAPEEEEENRRRYLIDAMPDNDPELLRLAAEEEAQRQEKRKKDDEELATALRQAEEDKKKATTPHAIPQTGTIKDLMPNEIYKAQETQLPRISVTTLPSYPQNDGQESTRSAQKQSPTLPAPSIAEQKLRVPSVATPSQAVTQKPLVPAPLPQVSAPVPPPRSPSPVPSPLPPTPPRSSLPSTPSSLSTSSPPPMRPASSAPMPTPSTSPVSEVPIVQSPVLPAEPSPTQTPPVIKEVSTPIEKTPAHPLPPTENKNRDPYREPFE